MNEFLKVLIMYFTMEKHCSMFKNLRFDRNLKIILFNQRLLIINLVMHKFTFLRR